MRPQGTQGLLGRGTSHLMPCFHLGGQVGIQTGHKDTGPAWGRPHRLQTRRVVSFLRRRVVPPHSRPCHSPRGAAVHPSPGPSPGPGAPLPPGDGWQARGRRLPWQPRHPQGNSEACKRVWARHASPAPSPSFRGCRKRMGGGGNCVYPAPHCLGVESHLGSRGTRPGRGSYPKRVWTRPWREVAKFKPR